MMKESPRYRGHTPAGSKLVGVCRVLFCMFAAGFSLARVIQGLRTGQVEAPLRGSHLMVTSASPAWFAVVLLAYCVWAVIFAFVSYALGKRLIEDFRS